ncbi:hypothetical protein MKP05_01440 [Halomonas sp. EGI 63088]|uniref:Uncharacterized protein n=1 Tax=Halomonas flagellata TaxID=2920385 RepID=A0ABS9RP98_9GAMM|nr:hypothetical protein [Halomonas flagellata]MCH4561789.1 hypothetical protein [Halomonas flagellata]
MGRFVIYLALLAGLAYGGLYVYYGVAVKQLIQEELDALGFTALQVAGVDYPPLAPVSNEARVAAEVIYRGAEASVELRLTGHPVFSDEVRMELDGLQALRLTIGTGGQQ